MVHLYQEKFKINIWLGPISRTRYKGEKGNLVIIIRQVSTCRIIVITYLTIQTTNSFQQCWILTIK